MSEGSDLEIYVPVTVETAWRALRDKEAVLQWHGWQADDLEREVEEIFFGDVVEDEENHVLTANGGDRFSVTADGDGARIRLTRAPLTGNAEWDVYYDDITEGWISFLQQLRYALTRGVTTARRTHFLHAGKHHFDEVASSLGIGELAGLAPESPFEAEIAGERVHGRVWFRSANQLGLTVAEWGEGLLVFGGPTPPAERGTTMAIVSTYGLSDADFDALGARWRERWPTNSVTPAH
ncbi:hypothetical protein [Amycolatopsis magusensis]|uniref:hypothetical protein n=1 Tax=Amycolatopsis magusensis TaxID=882444 RepID=UPI0037A64313